MVSTGCVTDVFVRDAIHGAKPCHPVSCQKKVSELIRRGKNTRRTLLAESRLLAHKVGLKQVDVGSGATGGRKLVWGEERVIDDGLEAGDRTLVEPRLA